jgi:hypothetical protein
LHFTGLLHHEALDGLVLHTLQGNILDAAWQLHAQPQPLMSEPTPYRVQQATHCGMLQCQWTITTLSRCFPKPQLVLATHPHDLPYAHMITAQALQHCKPWQAASIFSWLQQKIVCSAVPNV